jgi:MGT family glycosyltransferase
MRFLFAPFPATGHVNPGLPIARELVARGHDVRWYTTPRFRRAVEAAGATYVPYRHAFRIDEETLSQQFPRRPQAGGIRQLQFDIKHIFIDTIPGMLRDLEEELDARPADVVVGDNSAPALSLLRERRPILWAAYGVSVLMMSSRDTAPFGLGLLPSTTRLGRLRNRILTALTDTLIFRPSAKHSTRIRLEHGLPPSPHSLFDFAREADIYLHGSSPSFEYPRTDLAPNVRFIGATVPQPPAGWTPPTWWPELRSGRRVVLVTQGTINNDYDQLIRPAIRALAKQHVLVVVTTGSRNPEAVEIDPLPDNVRVERFLPYRELMPHVDLLLTNGGYGSVQIALAHGVPVVAIGKTEEKPEIANRVAWSGVGVGLKVRVPAEEQIRAAVTEVLSNPSYTARAETFRAEMSGMDAASRAAEYLEELAGAVVLARTA